MQTKSKVKLLFTRSCWLFSQLMNHFINFLQLIPLCLKNQSTHDWNVNTTISALCEAPIFATMIHYLWINQILSWSPATSHQQIHRLFPNHLAPQLVWRCSRDLKRIVNPLFLPRKPKNPQEEADLNTRNQVVASLEWKSSWNDRST